MSLHAAARIPAKAVVAGGSYLIIAVTTLFGAAAGALASRPGGYAAATGGVLSGMAWSVGSEVTMEGAKVAALVGGGGGLLVEAMDSNPYRQGALQCVRNGAAYGLVAGLQITRRPLNWVWSSPKLGQPAI